METVKSIAIGLDVPESTVRLYRDEFEEFLPASGEGRRRRYPAESAERLRQICRWKREGWTSVQVRDALARENRPQERVRRRGAEDKLEDLAALIKQQSGEIGYLRAEISTLRAALQDLVRVLEYDVPPTMEDVVRASRREAA